MPPLILTVAVPLLPPLQLTFVCDVVPVIADGCVMLTLLVVEQLFASVTVHVYPPAASPVAIAAVPPLGAHE